MTEPAQGHWFVYVIRCAGDRWYCGIAKDVEARYAEHASGQGAKFTRAFPPEALLVSRRTSSRSDALREEAAFKRLTRAKKQARIDEWRTVGG